MTPGPSATAPATTDPLTLSIAVTLGGFKLAPPVYKADGETRKKDSEVILEAVHQGTPGCEELLHFVTNTRGDLRVSIVPAEESGLDGWTGVGTLGTVKLDVAGEETAVSTTIRVSSSNVTTLEALIAVRLSMIEKLESGAILELVPVQPDLEF